MKLDTLIDMAKETAAFGVHPSGEYIYSFYTEQLQAFAKLVAQHAKAEEREACVQIVENEAYQYASPVWAFEIVNDIKARGQA